MQPSSLRSLISINYKRNCPRHWPSIQSTSNEHLLDRLSNRWTTTKGSFHLLTRNLSSTDNHNGASMDTTAKSESSSHVRLDLERRRFIMDLELPSKQVAWIEFKSIGENKIDMYHSEVPKELRGRGLGAKLAGGALEQAAANGLKVKLSCSYLIGYLDRCDDPNADCVVDR